MILDRVIEWLFPWRWLGVAAVLFWGFTMSSLVEKKGNKLKDEDVEELYPWAIQRKPQEGDEWMGLYVKGRKIGYTHSRTSAKGKGFLIESSTRMWMKLFNTQQRISTVSKVEVDDHYRMKKFTFRMKSPLSTFLAKGYVWRDRLFVTILIGKNKRQYQVPYRPSLLASALRPYIASKKPPPGRKIRALLFDPQSMSYQKALILVEGYELLTVMGKKVKALRIRQRYKGTLLHAWLDENGKVLKERSSAGMMLIRETVSKATSGQKRALDIIRATRVNFQGSISNPKTRPQLQLQLANIRFQDFPDLKNGRQHLSKKGLLTITRVDWSTLRPLPFSLKDKAPEKKKLSANLRKALKADHLVQSHHKKVRALAEKITTNATNRAEAIKALHLWLLKNIKKRSVVGLPSALETMRKRIGDCNEHATLLAALSRSVHIPCHIVSGLAFLRGQFYFHAWNECQIGKKQWVTVDSTWGQLPADATHINFVRGGLSQQMALMQLMNKLRIRVVSKRRRPNQR